jgi:hypothetical protein
MGLTLVRRENANILRHGFEGFGVVDRIEISASLYKECVVPYLLDIATS